MTYYYPAIIRKKNNQYRVDVIDLAGCYGEGKDKADALEDARDGMDFPKLTHLDDISLEEGEEKTMLAFLMPKEGWEE